MDLCLTVSQGPLWFLRNLLRILTSIRSFGGNQDTMKLHTRSLYLTSYSALLAQRYKVSAVPIFLIVGSEPLNILHQRALASIFPVHFFYLEQS